MATAADTLRAIEARAERAIVQELRLMRQEILGLRTQLVLEDRAHADALLLMLDHLERDQVAAPRSEPQMPAFPMPTLTLKVFETPLPKAYRAFFYAQEYGDLEDVVTVESFDAGVQLVRDRLARDGDYVITASWIKHQGEMTVATPSGMVMARIEADDSGTRTAQPVVLDACDALRTGDASRIEQLFGRMLEAARTTAGQAASCHSLPRGAHRPHGARQGPFEGGGEIVPSSVLQRGREHEYR